MKYRRFSMKEIEEIKAAKGLAKVIAHRYRISPAHLSRIRNHGWTPLGPKIGAAPKINAVLVTLACTGAP